MDKSRVHTSVVTGVMDTGLFQGQLPRGCTLLYLKPKPDNALLKSKILLK